MEEDFLTLLRSITALTDVVPSASIRWGSIPQGHPLPYILLTNVSDVRGLHMNGTNAMESHRVQIDIYALQYAQCKVSQRAIKDALHGYRQGAFRLIQDDGGRDLGLDTSGVQSDRPHRITNDYIINWSS